MLRMDEEMQEMADKFKEVMGKTLLKITDDNDDLQLHCEDGVIEFLAIGDCCSDSWVEHVESPSQPEKIVSFEEIEIPPTFNEVKTEKRPIEDMDVVKFYFYKITTDKGSYLIEMRNNSNGYYGGWLA